MKTLLLFLSFVFSLSLYSHYDSSVEDHQHLFTECHEKISEPLNHQALLKKPPRYPSLAQREGVEGIVVLQFDLTEEGKITNSKVLWSSSTGGDGYKESFSRAALKALPSWKYKPRKNQEGESIPTKGIVHQVTFLVEGYETTINLGTDFRKILQSTDRAINRKNPKKLEEALTKVNSVLKEEQISDIEKASYFYLKSLLLIALDRDNKEIQQLLLSSKEYYSIPEFIGPKGNSYYSLNKTKLLSFSGLILATTYLKQENWVKAEEEYLNALIAADVATIKNTRFVRALIQLGIASYNQEKWCYVVSSWERAKSLGKGYNIPFPAELKNALDYARDRYKQ